MEKSKTELAQEANNSGAAFLNEGKIDEAIQEFTKAIELNPNNAFAYLHRGSAWLKKGEFNKATEDYAKAIKLNPNDAEDNFDNDDEKIQLNDDEKTEIFNALKENDTDKVIEMLDKLIEKDPNNPTAYMLRGFYQNEPDKAIEDFNKVIELNPNDAEAYLNRGDASWHKKGEPDKAIEDYTKAIELKPNFIDAYFNRGKVLAEQGKYDEAIEDYRKTTDFDLDYRDVHTLIEEVMLDKGITLLEEGEYDKAIYTFEEILDVNQDFSYAYYNCGIAWERKRKYDKAIEYYNIAIELEPDNNENYYNNRGVVLLKTGEYEEAIANFDKAIEINPNLAQAYNNKKEALDELNKLPPHVDPNKKGSVLSSTKEAKPKAKPIKADSPRGLEEYSGEEWRARQQLTEAIGKVLEQRGFMPLETPTIEYDRMIAGFISPSEIFRVEGKDTKNMILRYDLTAPLARYVAKHFESLPKPFRRYQTGIVFRNDKPDNGRFKQFTQMDADTIGTDNPAADAEMVMTLCECLEAAGVRPSEYTIRVNHRAVLEKVFDTLGRLPLSRSSLMRILDKYDRLGENAIQALLGTGRKDESGDWKGGAELQQEQINALIGFLQLSKNRTRAQFLQEINSRYGENKGTEELATMNEIFAALGFDESRIIFDSSIVRGLDYYNGVVFEADVGSKIGSVGGGGRYDNLLKRFRGESVPSVGMSVGLSRLHTFLQAKRERAGAGEAHDESNPLIVILAMEQDQMPRYQQLAAKLRQQSLRAEVYVGNGNMRKQLKYADKRNARIALIQGEDERKQNRITIKDLQQGKQLAQDLQQRDTWREGTHAQQTIAEADLIATCLKMLSRERRSK